ncbi:MAG: efflux RND transporter periplasmic adaptor subunit [Pseudomonadota bacterium]
MHVQHLKRYSGRYWRLFGRVAVGALLLQGALALGFGSRAWAATQDNVPRVVVTVAEASASYDATRRYAGTVVASRASDLGFKFGGQIADIRVDLGEPVAAGALLAQLDDASQQAALSQARAAVAVARAQLDAATATAELAAQTEARFAGLLESRHVSEQQYDEQRLNLKARNAEAALAKAGLAQARAALQAAEVVVSEAQIRAPYAGVIQARHVDEGAQINPGVPVLRLVATSDKEAHVGVPEQLAARLAAGEAHEVIWGERAYPATLQSILPVVDRANRTLTAVFRVDEQAAAALPIGGVIELSLASTVAGDGFWVPMTALTESDRGLWGVYVVNGDEALERRLVEIVHTENARAFVRGTLSGGDRIVAAGVQRLVPGQRVIGVTGDPIAGAGATP